MRKTMLACTALGAVLLAALPPAAAQWRGGYGSAASPEMPSGQGGAGLIPPVQEQYRAARRAPESASVRVQLRAARNALLDRDWGLANEALGRAETSVLNHLQLAGRTMQNSDTLDHLNDARAALMDRDPREALRATELAMEAWDTAPNTAAAARGRAQGGGHGAGAGTYGPPPGEGGPRFHGGYGTEGGFSWFGPGGGTRTMPSRLMPGTSQFGNVHGEEVVPRGPPPAGHVYPQAGAQSSRLSTGGQIQPGSPTLGGHGR